MSKRFRASVLAAKAPSPPAHGAPGLLLGERMYDRAEIPPDVIADAAQAVRHVLLRDYPECRRLERQCKRAAVTLRAVLQKQRIEVQLIYGAVLGDHRDQTRQDEHVWCRVRNPRSGLWYLLDVALAQFEALFDGPVPDVVWGEYRSTVRRYQYVENEPPEWPFDPRQFDSGRVEAVRALLGH